MRIVLGLLADFAWILYAVCGVGILVYVFRAISLQRQLSVTFTAFERETVSMQVARMWRMAVVIVAVSIALLAMQMYVLPQLSLDDLDYVEETPVGLITATPSQTPTATPILGALPTITATIATPATQPPIPTPEVTDTPAPAPVSPTYPVGVRFGNVAELVGFDVSAQVIAGQPVGLTLYWRALEGAGGVEYWVFNHLIAAAPDVRLIAQHDGPPANGTRPTTTWVTDEVIVDYHELTFLPEEGGYTGAAEIRLGIYDPVAQVRVPLEGGGDLLILPVSITVTGQ